MRSGRIGPSSRGTSFITSLGTSSRTSPWSLVASPREAATSSEASTSCSMSTEPLRSSGSSTSSAMDDPDVDMVREP